VRDISALTVDIHIIPMSSPRRQNVSNVGKSSECLCSDRCKVQGREKQATSIQHTRGFSNLNKAETIKFYILTVVWVSTV